MSHDTGSSSGGPTASDVCGVAGSSVARRYEPPRVIPAGNLRDLVAQGGSGILRMQGIERLEEQSHTRR